jgi:hypothetical protein
MKFKRRKDYRCARCKKHPATFSVHGGRVRYDKQHDLCQRCFRAIRTANLARAMAQD